MNWDYDTRLALDPQFALRDDVDRAILITRPQPLSEKNYVSLLLHPRHAVLLSLMDGDRTIRELGDLWAELNHQSREQGLKSAEEVIGFFTSGDRAENGILIEVSPENRHTIRSYDPMDFMIPASRVNLSDPRMRKPYTVHYLPTLFCTQKCVYCYAKLSSKPESDFIGLERLREVFAELKELGTDVIQFSGGDPFARPDIFEILEAVFEAGMTPDVPTKLGLSYEEAVRLKALGVKILQVSLDSTDPAILEHMVGVKNYPRRVFQVLDNLRRAGLEVRVNTVLTPTNVSTVGPLIDYLGQLGNVVRHTLTPYGRSLFCHSDELFIGQNELECIRQEVEGRAALYPHMKINLSGGAEPTDDNPREKARRWKARALCTANRHGFVILPDGRATVCEELYDHPAFVIGDLKTQSVLDVWMSPAALSLVHPDQSEVPDGPCRTCSSFEACNSGNGRCWRDVLKSYGWGKPHFPDPRCPLAPPGNQLA